MRKRINYLIALMCFIMSLTGCQSDDLCPETTPTTPQLIIRFLDVENPTETLNVNSLRIFAFDNDSPLIDRQTTDSIAIPLQSFESETSFIMITDSADDNDGMETGNIDMLTFNYDTREVFISRACGFIANYDELTDSLTVDSDNWIQIVNIAIPNVENENQAHVQVFH